MNRLKELRKQKGLKQKDLAGLIGVSQSTLSEWESEKYQIDNDNLFKLADYFGVSVDYLLGRDSQSVNSDSHNTTIESDIQDKLNEVLSQLDAEDADLLFNGESLDPDSRELLAASIERTIRLAKELQLKRQAEDDIS